MVTCLMLFAAHNHPSKAGRHGACWFHPLGWSDFVAKLSTECACTLRSREQVKAIPRFRGDQRTSYRICFCSCNVVLERASLDCSTVPAERPSLRLLAGSEYPQSVSRHTSPTGSIIFSTRQQEYHRGHQDVLNKSCFVSLKSREWHTRISLNPL
jgi:hypothetical protein